MTPEEKALICQFAKGDKSLREKAVKIYRSYLVKTGRCTDEMRFMSEVDSPCPDLSLRSIYRKRLIGG